MNTGKKTVDTEKETASGREPNRDFKAGFHEPSPTYKKRPEPNNNKEERKTKDPRKESSSQLVKKQPGTLSKAQREKATGFYCIGDLPFYLFFHAKSKQWSKVDFSEESFYKGGLKYPSIIRLGKTDEIILTGG